MPLECRKKRLRVKGTFFERLYWDKTAWEWGVRTSAKKISSGAALLLCACTFVPQARAQTAAQQPSNDALPELLQSVRDLRAQVNELNTQLDQVRSAQQESAGEAKRLRQELEAANQRIKALETPAAASSAPAVNQGPKPQAPQPPPVSIAFGDSQQNESLEAHLARLDENSELLNAKVTDQYQTKVESGSKYRLRLSGIFLLNLYGNAGLVNNQDFPEFASELKNGFSDRAFGGSLRQSQINLEGFGPDLAGAHTSANLRFDFAGNTLENAPNGGLLGGVRLRTGVFRMDWANTSLVAGQDALFFVPLSPSSLASLAVPALSYSGNLWGWTPQVRFEHKIALSKDSEFRFAAGILDQISGDVNEPGQERDPSWGEQSGQPGYAVHLGWSKKTESGAWSLGAGGYYGRQYWPNGSIDSWAATVDLLIPISRDFDFSAAYYRGRAVGGFGGGIGQTVVYSGPPAFSPSGLNSQGGWAQLTYKPRSELRINAAWGQDNPFASQLREFPIVPSAYPRPLLKNQTWFVNGIYQLRSNILFSLEFRRIATNDLGPIRDFANNANLSLGYLF
jgi:hypothetical protein